MVRGGQITTRPAAFTPDGRRLIVPSASGVKLYDCSTADCVEQVACHAAEVTSVHPVPQSSEQVWTTSSDGTIKLWSLPHWQLLRSFSVGSPVEHLVFLPDEDMVLLSLHWREGQAGRILPFSLSKGRVPANSVAYKTNVQGPPLVPSPSGAFAATFEVRSLNVWELGAAEIKPVAFHHTKEFQCVCIDPGDQMLAAGDVSGRILLWHSFPAYVSARRAGRQVAVPQCTTWHWHAQPVGCLLFTSDSTYLLSGGKEGVLVIWDVATGERNYLPRLGSGLCSIAPCPTHPSLYAVGQEDNTIRLFNLTTMTLQCSIHGVRPPPRGVSALELNGCTALHPRGRHVVLSGNNCSLQFYDPLMDRHVSKLQVVLRNNLLNYSQQLPSPPGEPRVAHLCFSGSGDCMATLDVRPDPTGRQAPTEALRFWDEVAGGVHANQAAPYRLNTHVEQPHSEGTSTMRYHPAEHVVVTAGPSSGFRLWQRSAAGQGAVGGSGQLDPSKRCWKCSCTGSYRNMPFHSSAFSADGTMLALGSSSCVVLWEYPSVSWLATLPCPGAADPKSAFHSVVFPGDDVYVVGASQGGAQPRVVVWDVSTLSPLWVLPLHTCSLCPHPRLPLFAVAVPARLDPSTQASMPTSMVLVFDATSPRPRLLVRVPDCMFPWVAFAPQVPVERDEDSVERDEDTEAAARVRGVAGPCGPLLVLSERRAIRWALLPGERLQAPSSAPSLTSSDALAASKLRSLFGESEAGAPTTQDMEQDSVLLSAQALPDTVADLARVAKLLDMPSHLLPPASLLCERALELMLIPAS